MVDSKAPRADRLPIKLIMPNQGKEKRVSPGGTPPKPFRPVDAAYRKSLSTQVNAIRDAVLPQTQQSGAAPVRVRLLVKAAAKSHRPEQIFSSETCPIIGAGRLGELFLKATPGGLTRLAKVIESDQSQRVKKELSCIEAIETVTPAYRRRGIESQDVLRRSPRGKEGFITRVRLFNFGAGQDQATLVKNFEETCLAHKIGISTTGYSPSSFIYGAECRSVEDVEVLSRVIGVRSVVSMPLIRTLRPKM